MLQLRSKLDQENWVKAHVAMDGSFTRQWEKDFVD
jgi:hypothetical protein